jgi:ankyrin repeat protein
MWAAKEGFIIAVELLLDAKADFNVRNQVRASVLCKAKLC